MKRTLPLRIDPLVTVVAAILTMAGISATSRGAGVDAALVNLSKGDCGAICAAAAQLGLGATELKDDQKISANTRLIVFSSEDHLNEEEAKQLGETVRNGAALLVVMNDKAGKDAMTMSFMLPTMAWSHKHVDEGPFTASEFDPEMFGSATPTERGLAVPYAHEIRPFHAVERGQARYDELNRLLKYPDDADNAALPPEINQWTRPLIDHDWRIRVRAAGDLALPLLITGQYGRGRVAVFASGANVLDAAPQGKAFWSAVMKWLLAEPAVPAESAQEEISKPAVTIDRAKRLLNVELTNASSMPYSAIVIAREMTWEPALIGDVEKPITVPGHGKALVALDLPAENQMSYAAVAAQDAYEVRLGVLSGDGSKLLSETRVHADLRPTLLMRLDADDVRAYAWPFDPAQALGLGERMGTRMDEYAYKPGDVIHAQMTFDNGTRNIAKLARPKDETTPDNASITAINLGSPAGERVPMESVHVYGAWHGVKGVENVVSLTFPKPVLVNAIDLIGAADELTDKDRKNPAAIVMEMDGKEVASESKLSDRMLAEKGDVRLAFNAVQGTTLRLHFPWPKDDDREAPVVGDVQVWGTQDAAFGPAVHGTASLALIDSLTGSSTPVGSKQIEIAAGGNEVVKFDVATPKTDGKANFYRLEAKFADGSADQSGDQVASRPVMTLEPRSVLQSIDTLRAHQVGAGFIVTRGFRLVFHTGTGTDEIPKGWETPDDLVWAYERGFKENSERSPYLAAKLFVTDNDMKHYSTQWRDFQGGEPFYDVATPHLVENWKAMPEWKDATVAHLGHSDRWDAGPPVMQQFSWPEFIAFDHWLRSKQLGKLTGRTKDELSKEILEKYRGAWYAFHLEQFQHSVTELKEAFAAAGKALSITSQGCPLLPPKFAEAISYVFRGSSDDSSWGMQHDDIITTTGKQMGAVAFNPYLQMATLAQWQYNSNTLNNPQWHVPIGSTEPSRRHQYDRAFRGTLRLDGSFTSIHSFGFNSNAGAPVTLTSIDYDQWKQVRDLFALMQPEAPLGAGVVIANSYLNDPKNTRFSAVLEGSDESYAIMRSFGMFERAGISLPFSSNALSLEKWQGNAPLIVLNLARFTPEELSILKKTMQRGVHVAAFAMDDFPLPAEAAAMFGVDPSGAVAGDGKQIGTVEGHPIVAKGVGIYVPLSAIAMHPEQIDSIGPLLVEQLQIPIKFETGSTGYGFVSNGRQFIVLEDWREESRTIHLRLKAGGGTSATAVGVNDGVQLPIKKDGSDWLIDVPTRPGDANLICVQEDSIGNK